ncbi:MAG: hypothetical protein V4568_10900 [Pseudomonadota bacterium]
MPPSPRSFDSLGRASYKQDDQVTPPGDRDPVAESAPASQPYASPATPAEHQGDKNEDLVAPRAPANPVNKKVDTRNAVGNKKESVHKASHKTFESDGALVSDTGQEDPGSQVG